MSFILSEQRKEWPERLPEHWARYRAYVHERRDGFPAGAYALATSNWYFDSTDHRCPHDAWLESAGFSELSAPAAPQQRATALRVTLLGAYHDLWLDLTYVGVTSYALTGDDVARGLGDWRYDEFRLSDSGRLIHEIEWARDRLSGRWVIEADDVVFASRPRSHE